MSTELTCRFWETHKHFLQGNTLANSNMVRSYITLKQQHIILYFPFTGQHTIRSGCDRVWRDVIFGWSRHRIVTRDSRKATSGFCRKSKFGGRVYHS